MVGCPQILLFPRTEVVGKCDKSCHRKEGASYYLCPGSSPSWAAGSLNASCPSQVGPSAILCLPGPGAPALGHDRGNRVEILRIFCLFLEYWLLSWNRGSPPTSPFSPSRLEALWYLPWKDAARHVSEHGGVPGVRVAGGAGCQVKAPGSSSE
jgi:hypothetical protein